MAGLPDYSSNPIQSGNSGQNGDKSMEVALATKMQLILDQPMADVDSGLTNRDFEGDFFKIGDSVAIVKPDVESLTIEFGKLNGGIGPAFGTINTLAYPGKAPMGADTTTITTGTTSTTSVTNYCNKDARLIPGNVRFEKNVMTIDKYTKYAFYISDLTEAEGKWNYESGNLDAVAQEIRKRHNLETVQMIVNSAADQTQPDAVPSLESSPTTPITVATGDELYEKVIVPIFGQLYDEGAITADGQITYGSNSQQGKSTYGQLFLPTKAYTTLLVSKYLQDRSTVAADEKVATGKVKTVMGLDVAIEPSLNPTAKRHVTIANAGEGVFCIVAGTRNLITKAGKVLPPDKFRSHRFFADEYHGMEIYGKKIVEPKAGVCVFVKIQAAQQGE